MHLIYKGEVNPLMYVCDVCMCVHTWICVGVDDRHQHGLFTFLLDLELTISVWLAGQ